MKLEEGTPVRGHIEQMRRVVGQLATLGSRIQDDQYKITLLRSLSKPYESLVVTLENMLEGMAIEDLHARILREGLRQGDARPGVKDTGALLNATRNHSKPRFKCYHCGKPGHKKAQC